MTTPPTSPRPAGWAPGEPQYTRALWALFAMGLATFAMIYVVQPLMALISADMGITATQSTLLLAVQTFAIALAVIPLARLAERVGRARIIISGLSIGVVLGLLTPLVPTFELMLITRALQGAALAAIPAAALAWVAENIDGMAVTRVGGLYIAGTTVGGMGGRVIGGVLAELVGWVAAMLIVALLAAALTVTAAILLPKPRMIADDEAAQLSANSSPSHGGERISGTDLHTQFQALRPTRVRLYLMGGLGMAMFVGVYNVIGYRTAAPPFLLGAGLGSMFYLTYAAGTFTSSMAGRIEARTGLRAVVLIGFSMCAAGVALTLPDSMVLIWIGLAVIAGGFFVVHAVASSTTARLSPVPSTGAGIYTFAYYLGSSIGGVALGRAWEDFAWLGTAVACVALISIAVVIAMWLPRGRPDRPGTTRPLTS